MSTTALFSIGAVVFLFTVWGVLMVFAFWLGERSEGRNRRWMIWSRADSPRPGPDYGASPQQ